MNVNLGSEPGLIPVIRQVFPYPACTIALLAGLMETAHFFAEPLVFLNPLG